jgi:hypothetical protein
MGRYVEHNANCLAHSLGWGPIAVTRRIQKAFGVTEDERRSKLDDFYRVSHGMLLQSSCNFRELQKDCRKLMKFALP